MIPRRCCVCGGYHKMGYQRILRCLKKFPEGKAEFELYICVWNMSARQQRRIRFLPKDEQWVRRFGLLRGRVKSFSVFEGFEFLLGKQISFQEAWRRSYHDFLVPYMRLRYGAIVYECWGLDNRFLVAGTKGIWLCNEFDESEGVVKFPIVSHFETKAYDNNFEPERVVQIVFTNDYGKFGLDVGGQVWTES